MKRSLSVAIPILILLTSLSGASHHSAWERLPPATTDADEPNGEENENDEVRDRALLYLRRHGYTLDTQSGAPIVHPNQRLEMARQQYEKWKLEESRRGFAPEGVGGTNWVSLGPNNGAGRMTAIAPHPTAKGTVYVGAAGGGVWKTTDLGGSWTPLTDSIPDLSVGALSLAPSEPNIIYLGTGEAGFGPALIPGIGLLKSSDGGSSWQFPSRVVATTFYRISVHPASSVELVAGTNEGGLRSTDGGSTWTTVIDSSLGQVSDVVRDPSNPSTLYGAAWDIVNSVSRVLKSTDGGSRWLVKSTGLPSGAPDNFSGRIAMAIASSRPSTLYVAIEVFTPQGTRSHIYKSTDGAESWTDLTGLSGNPGLNRFLGGQSDYDITISVSPADPNTVIAGGQSYVRSTDGGTNWENALTAIHVDAHDLRYQGSNLYIANDGGIWSSTDDGRTATGRNGGLVTHQYYALVMDPVNRNRVFAGSQDNGTNRRPDSGAGEWLNVQGGDGFACAVNPDSPPIVYVTIQNGKIYRTFGAGNDPVLFPLVDISPQYDSLDVKPFATVLTMDPGNPSTLYTGTSRLRRSTDGGDSWALVPIATRDGSSLSVGPIVTIAVAHGDSSILMLAGYNGVIRSTDGGTTWVQASAGLPSADSNNLEIDPGNPDIAYVALPAAGPGVRGVYRTTDGGRSWSARSSGLPAFSAQVVRVDPTDSNFLYCGTDVGLYHSTDQGANWTKFGVGLPNSSVHDLRILDDGSVLRVATHGRGIWELQVPPTGNTPPLAVISNPAGNLAIRKGSTQSFSGAVSDGDPGDLVIGRWTFSDDWQAIPTAAGASIVSHTFNRPGNQVVSLSARDGHQARGAASLVIHIADTNEPLITSAVFDGKKTITIEGSSLGAAQLVIINDHQVDLVILARDAEVVVKGKPKKLRLIPGENRIQVIANELISNAVTFLR